MTYLPILATYVPTRFANERNYGPVGSSRFVSKWDEARSKLSHVRHSDLRIIVITGDNFMNNPFEAVSFLALTKLPSGLSYPYFRKPNSRSILSQLDPCQWGWPSPYVEIQEHRFSFNAEPAGDGLTRTMPSPAGSALNNSIWIPAPEG